VLVLAGGSDPAALPLKETRQAVPLPSLEVVGDVSRSGTKALVSDRAEFVDQVRMEVPALRDEVVHVPCALGVDPIDHLIEPLPDLATQPRFVARGWVPRSGKAICRSKGLSVFLMPDGSGEPQVRIRHPHPLTDVGEVADPNPWGRPT